MKLKPLGSRILVEPIDDDAAEKTTESGLVLPDTANVTDAPQRGTVVSVGDGEWDEDGEKRIPVDVTDGDTVIYSKYGGTKFELENRELVILRHDDVIAKVV